MKERGINVVVDKNGKRLKGNKAAGFDYSNGTIYIRKNPGVIDLYHEAFHAQQYLDIGQESYRALGVLKREEYVYNRLMEIEQIFNEAELLNATKYINRIRDRGGK